MRKISVRVLAVGVATQLLVLAWFFNSAPSCMMTFASQPTAQNGNDKKKFEADELLSQENSSNSLSSLDERSSMRESLSLLKDNLDSDGVDPEPRTVDVHDKKKDHGHSATQIFFYIFAFLLAGLITATGLFLALFVREKKPVKLHVYRIGEESLLSLRGSCMTCGQLVGYTIKAGKETTQNHKLWVVQITLNAPTRRKYMLAVQELVLPVIRREHDFVVVGPYRQKQDAAQVLTCLSEQYGLRGWLIEGH